MRSMMEGLSPGATAQARAQPRTPLHHAAVRRAVYPERPAYTGRPKGVASPSLLSLSKGPGRTAHKRKGAQVALRALETRRCEAISASRLPTRQRRRPKQRQQRQQRLPYQRQQLPYQRPKRRQRHHQRLPWRWRRRRWQPQRRRWRRQRLLPHPSSRPRDRERRQQQQQRERSCACMVSLNSEWTKHGTRPGRKPTAIVDFARQLTSLARGCKYLVAIRRCPAADQRPNARLKLCRGCDRKPRVPGNFALPPPRSGRPNASAHGLPPHGFTR